MYARFLNVVLETEGIHHEFIVLKKHLKTIVNVFVHF